MVLGNWWEFEGLFVGGFWVFSTFAKLQVFTNLRLGKIVDYEQEKNCCCDDQSSSSTLAAR
jgi:hypothetical protein